MMNQNGKNFTYLNREGQWRGHHWDGLAITSDGSLELLPLPLGNPADSQALTGIASPDAPAGIARGDLGTIYFSDPPHNRIFAIDGCDASHRRLACIGGEGSGPARLKQPRGLLWSVQRQALFVVDSGNHRIQIFNPMLGQVLEMWGQEGPQPGQFHTPWTIAGDTANAFYVVDYGNQRVQKFDILGAPVPEFWDNVAASKLVLKPCDVAAGTTGGAIRIYIADQVAHAVFVFDQEGQPVKDASGQPISFGAAQLAAPMGIAAIGDDILIGDNQRRQVLGFDAAANYQFAGAAVGFQGPVAALTAGASGQLLVLASADVAPIVLQLDQGYSSQGVFWTDAIAGTGGKVTWHRFEAISRGLSSDAHLQLFFYTSDNLSDAPPPPKLSSAGINPFAGTKWCQKPPDVPDVFLGTQACQNPASANAPAVGQPHSYIWCGAWFSSDGLGSPKLSQIRLEFNHTSYLSDLPVIYRTPGDCCDFLLRLLSLYETFNESNERKIQNLPALFDPRATPKQFLTWLAEWLAVDLEEDWDEDTTRKAIESAFARYARRGTPGGLRAAIKEYAGVDAIIEEPIQNASWWVLPAPAASPCGTVDPGAPVTWQATENSVLGFTTMAAPAEAQGAVVGTSAVLDQSHLIEDTDYGVPLFEDVAYQFSVFVYRGQVNCPATLALVESVIDQEKPAHTTSQLCILEPDMRVGFQARVGIDAVVGGSPPSMRLGETPDLGVDTVLGGAPAGRVGARLGQTAFVG